MNLEIANMVVYVNKVLSHISLENISSFAAFGSAFAAFMTAFITKNIANKQCKISLYNERYNKIYKLVLDTIEETQNLFLTNWDGTKQKEIMQKFSQDINYARFLIKEKDYKKIFEIYKQIYNLLCNQYNEYSKLNGLSKFETTGQQDLAEKKLKDLPVLNDKIFSLKNDFLAIIIPYLQVEKPSFWETIKNKFSKEGEDDL